MMKGNASNPIISVVVPVYNTESYLRKCIASIQAQTYKNLEIICVDDGSADRSGIILDNMAKSDRRLHILHTENRGVSEARNTALELASGEFISFIDSDDYIEPDMYNLMIQGMRKQEVDIVTCNYSMVYGNEVVRMINKVKVPEKPLDTIKFLEYVYERDIYKGVAGYICTRLFRRSLIMDNISKEIAVVFDNRLSFGEDVVFMAEISMRARQVFYIHKSLYNYVQHEESAAHNRKKQLEKLDWIRAYEHVVKIYEENNVPEKIVDLVKRMYVYRCGKTLETAFERGDHKKCEMLKKNIKDNLETYIKTNINYLDRIQWIIALLQKKL